MSDNKPNTLGGAIPIFPVANLEAAIRYYVDALGFKLDWEGPGVFASVTRDKCHIFLCQGDQGHPGTWTWIGCHDAATLETEFRERGGTIRHRPTNYPWAYEMQVEDLDGNVLRFGSDSKEGEPYGEWLDMHGRVWPPSGGS